MRHERDFSPYIRLEGEIAHMDFMVEGVHCAGCMSKIEKGLGALEGVSAARLNLGTKRLGVDWHKGALGPKEIMEKVESLGFKAHPFLPEKLKSAEKAELASLLRALAVAGFGMMNVMLFSVSVWFGHDIGHETRELFHWISALIALPCGLYAAMPFFKSAARALSKRTTNMDVPISIGITLTIGLSLYETATGGHHAYFESALMLMFFLLTGRVLDQMMRARARDFAVNVASLRPQMARVMLDGGVSVETPVSALETGQKILLMNGDGLAVDGRVLEGAGEVDVSLLTGESALLKVGAGDTLQAGTLNMGANLVLEVIRVTDTSVDKAAELMERALASKSTVMAMADRAAKIYAPVVHLAALLTFIGWMMLGAGTHTSLVIAISVLIITCPCALGLAIPAVQVVAGGRLFSDRIILNRGEAIERLAEVDTVVFDKTGTLTLAEPSLINADELPPHIIALAASMGRASRHPLAIAVAGAMPQAPIMAGAREFPGEGVEAVYEGETLRLGSAAFSGAKALHDKLLESHPDASFIYFKKGEEVYPLILSQRLRPDARQVVAGLNARGYRLIILSGDQWGATEKAAITLGIEEFQGAMLPHEKIAFIKDMEARGHKVLMVGDGLNDAPALAAAHVSLSPVTAAELAQNAADAVFLGAELAPVLKAIEACKKAHRLMRENLWLAVIYNIIAVPIAILGYVTPLVAAAAMSISSILVTLNALRARKGA